MFCIKNVVRNDYPVDTVFDKQYLSPVQNMYLKISTLYFTVMLQRRKTRKEKNETFFKLQALTHLFKNSVVETL